MATKIKILPEQLTNKIAAGEVVERPASVAKELIENALDAGATEVLLEIQGGGRRLIRVSDDGCGMTKEDALLSFERHATSKISSDDDLFVLATLGFRGEALPSIASVSRLTLATRTADQAEGTEIYVEGGKIKEVKGCGMAAGTIVTVRNLFFNTPARLKFMKGAETEGGHVGELVLRLALSRPDVRFTYINDGKVVTRVLSSDLKDRFCALLGRSLSGAMFPLSYADPDGLNVSGLIATPAISRSAGTHIYTYINDRFIRDKTIHHAVLQGYRSFLEKGRYPVVAIFIKICPDQVDVNVHPTKHEVRFREQGRVHDAIKDAVEATLKEAPWLRLTGFISERGTTMQLSVTEETNAPSKDPKVKERSGNGRSVVATTRVSEVKEFLTDYRPQLQPTLRYENRPSPTHAEIAAVSPAVTENCTAVETGREASDGYLSSLTVIGQFNASYIVCEDSTDLILIDQHAAHERVAFERLKASFSQRKIQSQGLLFPETMELSFRESAALREYREEMADLGFLIEEFGGTTWILKSVPQLLASRDHVMVVREVLEEFSSFSRSRALTDVQEEILARLACHSVVRGRRSLTMQEISVLLAQMDAAGFSGNCPHGRPVMQRLTIADVEKMFKRA